ncbi:DNA cytosine methyltransferase [Aestuariimicrobium sp. T2.26MG-19.2B]|uniref:DNA cytosine methyltransferase n=1 Tax=Aestuariimicrobium sp. T2.26MG-19.2B TaxID=3040679 RepID=UPI002477745F|nr:DNA cytosine methyltransferase [Aestuariimicrobium sp. T2.26MG-19.2B]CAI9405051.1 hypothetical protein AESSP_01334 [Aestuariimicrobium sp. T2.26MG-19.2B]
MNSFPVIDVFAGPGGLNEGFSRAMSPQGTPAFDVLGSFEMESNAIATLRLRHAVRALGQGGDLPERYLRFLNSDEPVESLLSQREWKAAWLASDEVVHQVKLGEDTRGESDAIIRAALGGRRDFVLIGGPPCQAYSLAGRSRRANDATFADDEKHFLFREYLHILEEHQPAVFVMENVKGLLSATHSGYSMFDRIFSDLSMDGTYAIHSMVVDSLAPAPSDFVIRSESFGIPQRRHRVILLGVRHDIHVDDVDRLRLQPRAREVSADVVLTLPPARSTVSRMDSEEGWKTAREIGWKLARRTSRAAPVPPLATTYMTGGAISEDRELAAWLRRPGLEGVRQHEPRSHMAMDLQRYAYMAELARTRGEAPSVHDLPGHLLPHHRNVGAASRPFADRFKVVFGGRPSGTIVSHIAKDGHHFIHPDPEQMRSLTVREAARLQTFPDDYFFMGNRTAQYHQVGNAVPPYLAFQIAEIVEKIMRCRQT